MIKPTLKGKYQVAYAIAKDVFKYSTMINTDFSLRCDSAGIELSIGIRALDSYRNSLKYPSIDLFDRLHAKLVDQYASDIRESFNWDDLRDSASDDIENNLADYGESFGSVYLGTVFDLYPSGKYLHVLANSNWDDIEAMKDSAYSEALDRVAEEHKGCVESGDNDPCDLFFRISWD